MQALEVFWRFLLLGCVSFGGPAAHIGYFQRTFVDRLQWLDQNAYGRVVALSQFLPGPGSSQTGFALGLRRAGLAGGLAAFIGFTLPSFVLMYLLAVGSAGLADNPWFNGVVAGLKLLAVVVVADATWTMFNAFCKQRLSQLLAIATAMLLLSLPALWTQMLALLLAAGIGASLLQSQPASAASEGHIRYLPLALFALLLFGLPLLAAQGQWLQLGADFYQAGSLVFGGGHVVLPLLQQSVGDALAGDRFLLGYAAAQAVPGPMFTLATFLGAELIAASPLLAALTATLAIFLPGFLLVLALHDAWERLAARPRIAGAVAGINAAVVGLLLSALYQPVFVSAVHEPAAMAAVLAGLFALRVWRCPIILLVVLAALTGILLN